MPYFRWKLWNILYFHVNFTLFCNDNFVFKHIHFLFLIKLLILRLYKSLRLSFLKYVTQSLWSFAIMIIASKCGGLRVVRAKSLWSWQKAGGRKWWLWIHSVLGWKTHHICKSSLVWYRSKRRCLLLCMVLKRFIISPLAEKLLLSQTTTLWYLLMLNHFQRHNRGCRICLWEPGTTTLHWSTELVKSSLLGHFVESSRCITAWSENWIMSHCARWKITALNNSNNNNNNNSINDNRWRTYEAWRCDNDFNTR